MMCPVWSRQSSKYTLLCHLSPFVAAVEALRFASGAHALLSSKLNEVNGCSLQKSAIDPQPACAVWKSDWTQPSLDLFPDRLEPAMGLFGNL